MSRPRHCMVVHAYYPVGETRVQREAMALVDRGFDVDVLCLRDTDEPRRERIDGIDIHRLPIARHRDRGMAGQLLEYLTFFVLAAARLTRLQLSRRYHSVQVHNLPDFLVFVAVVPKLTGTPVILDLHDLMPEFFAARTERGSRSLAYRVVAFQERLSCRFADHVITVTEEWRRTLGDRSVPIERVSVVMNLADPKVFQRRAAMAGGARSGGFRVLYHGTFTERYGVDVLVRAVHQAGPDVPGLRLELLGDGDARDDLVALIDRLGAADLVAISDGMIEASHLPAAIADADVGVVPNRRNVFTDGLLPTKLLEYVAMGTPVIASRTPGLSGYFDDNMVEYCEAGSVDSLAAAIRSLAGDESRRMQLADKADTFNDRFDWESMAASYVDTVERLGKGS